MPRPLAYLVLLVLLLPQLCLGLSGAVLCLHESGQAHWEATDGCHDEHTAADLPGKQADSVQVDCASHDDCVDLTMVAPEYPRTRVDDLVLSTEPLRDVAVIWPVLAWLLSSTLPAHDVPVETLAAPPDLPPLAVQVVKAAVLRC